ncbi:MAG TPA: uroporphyrinogen decarboxylase family protein [Chloroflexota bacterium]|nr:uroporphyrinogen decarboxylase family protein [Chloroflexota bacterium]
MTAFRSSLPLLPVSSIGSLPKPRDLFQAEMAPLREQDRTAIGRAQRDAVAMWLDLQRAAGVDLAVDGEQYRRSMTTYFLEGWGCAEIDPDPVWVLDNMYGQRAVIERAATKPRTLLVEWYRFASRASALPLKVTITGPYTLRDWVFDRYYPTRQAAVHALAEYVREEVQALVGAGARYVQIDEPAFVTRYDQPAELDLAVEAMRRALDGVPDDVLVFTHMCYGAFHEVYPKMLELPAQVFCLELSHVSPELLNILRRHPYPADRGMGFGVVDAMDPRVESVEEIEGRIRLALEYFRPEQLWLNPDCGLQTLPYDSAVAKLRNLVAAARRVRATLA